jgi:hypothetical protein
VSIHVFRSLIAHPWALKCSPLGSKGHGGPKWTDERTSPPLPVVTLNGPIRCDDAFKHVARLEKARNVERFMHARLPARNPSKRGWERDPREQENVNGPAAATIGAKQQHEKKVLLVIGLFTPHSKHFTIQCLPNSSRIINQYGEHCPWKQEWAKKLIPARTPFFAKVAIIDSQ